MKNKMNKKYTLNRKVVLRNLSIITILTLLIIFGNNIFGKNELKTKEIIVEQNETLWSIAKDISKVNSSNIQETIYKIKKMNSLESSSIYEGQILNIPVYN